MGRLGQGFLEVEVDQIAEGEEEKGRDEEGSEVFNDEDCAPRNLGTCSLWRDINQLESVQVAADCGFGCPRSYFRNLEELAVRIHTKVLDMDDTGLFQSGILDSRVLRIGNHTAVASFGDAQTVDRSTGGCSDSIINVLAGRSEGNGERFGELANGLAWGVVSRLLFGNLTPCAQALHIDRYQLGNAPRGSTTSVI